jgi:hypothetical protein
MQIALLTLAAFLTLASGCTSISKSEFETAQEAMKGSPGLKRDAIAECTHGVNGKPAAEKANVAKLMNVSLAAMPSLYCTRMMNAIASGRISYSDAQAFERGTKVPEMIQIIQGR